MTRSILCMCAVLWSISANAGTVYFSTQTPVHALGGKSFLLEVRGKDFPDALDGGGLDITFDDHLFEFGGVTFASEWKDLTSEGVASNGKVSDIFFNTFSMAGVSGDFPIASLEFTALERGTGVITLSGSTSFPFAGGGHTFDAHYGSLAVSVIPEPAVWAALVFLVGLVAVAAPLSQRC